MKSWQPWFKDYVHRKHIEAKVGVPYLMAFEPSSLQIEALARLQQAQTIARCL